MIRRICVLILSAAIYGFSIGYVHSLTFAVRNLAKFPLLMIVTALVCAPFYLILARFLSTGLSFGDVRKVVMGLMQDLSVLLASLSPICLFLALTIEKPVENDLRDYPFFLGFNVGIIAVCGCLSLVKHGLLLGHSAQKPSRIKIVLLFWMSVSLVVGGQWAWYLRPFFGVSTISAESTPFCLGTEPDFRGARSFFEAVYHIVRPPQR